MSQKPFQNGKESLTRSFTLSIFFFFISFMSVKMCKKNRSHVLSFVWCHHSFAEREISNPKYLPSIRASDCEMMPSQYIQFFPLMSCIYYVDSLLYLRWNESTVQCNLMFSSSSFMCSFDSVVWMLNNVFQAQIKRNTVQENGNNIFEKHYHILSTTTKFFKILTPIWEDKQTHTHTYIQF